MYNIYKYQEDVKLQESMRHQDEAHTKWLLRHQQLKANASQKIKKRTRQFLSQQAINPSIVEDDHYKTWRYNKQFRDIEDSNKFIGFKSFRHRPNYDVDKYFTERQRKQIKYLADKSQQLVKSRKIPQELRSRSLRSQGPLNPKHTFRDRKTDHEYLQPRMRYTNITDKQRHLQNSVTFDDKFSKVYDTFNMTKSKIGSPKISPNKSKVLNANPAFDMIESTYSDVGKNQQYHYDAMNQEEIQNSKQASPTKTGDSWRQKQKVSPRRTYFKTAKTLALQGDRTAQQIMVQTQYDRTKDLTNLRSNLTNESFVKRPIL